MDLTAGRAVRVELDQAVAVGVSDRPSRHLLAVKKSWKIVADLCSYLHRRAYVRAGAPLAVWTDDGFFVAPREPIAVLRAALFVRVCSAAEHNASDGDTGPATKGRTKKKRARPSATHNAPERPAQQARRQDGGSTATRPQTSAAAPPQQRGRETSVPDGRKAHARAAPSRTAVNAAGGTHIQFLADSDRDSDRDSNCDLGVDAADAPQQRAEKAPGPPEERRTFDQPDGPTDGTSHGGSAAAEPLRRPAPNVRRPPTASPCEYKRPYEVIAGPGVDDGELAPNALANTELLDAARLGLLQTGDIVLFQRVRLCEETWSPILSPYESARVISRAGNLLRCTAIVSQPQPRRASPFEVDINDMANVRVRGGPFSRRLEQRREQHPHQHHQHHQKQHRHHHDEHPEDRRMAGGMKDHTPSSVDGEIIAMIAEKRRSLARASRPPPQSQPRQRHGETTG